MSLATISGQTVLRLSVHLPASGIWWADVEADSEETLSGSVELALPGLTLTGTVMSGGPYHGRARYRVAGGAGGWGRELRARSYSNDAGVKLARVLQDAAAECGESMYTTGETRTVGPYLVRDAGPASRVLGLQVPGAWYVGEDGVTYLGARTASTYEGEATRMGRDYAAGWLELGADDLEGLVPGVVVDDLAAVDVVHTIRDGLLRTRIWGAGRSSTSRLGTAVERMIAAALAPLRYQGVWSYRVVAQSGERLDLQPERSSAGMPDLLRVRVRPGVPGCTADYVAGSLVLVAFVDADPGRPVVVAGDDPESAGFYPDRIDIGDGETILGGTEAGRALRYGDGHVCAFTGVSVPLVATPAVPFSASKVRL